MGAPIELLRRKALGAIQAIEKLSAEERAQLPTDAFGEDYNKLLDAIRESDPGLTHLLPPYATIGRLEHYGMRTRQSFGELMTWYSQIYHLLE
jgi:hypothetical protein